MSHLLCDETIVPVPPLPGGVRVIVHHHPLPHLQLKVNTTINNTCLFTVLDEYLVPLHPVSSPGTNVCGSQFDHLLFTVTAHTERKVRCTVG